MITVQIRFFAGHRDIVGQTSQTRQIEHGTTIDQLWHAVVKTYPQLAHYTGRLLYAINQEFATPEQVLCDGDEVAFIPPVSGGAPFSPFRISRERIDPAALVAYVQTAEDGAVVTFAGVVRNHSGGRATAYLNYEAYTDMATAVLVQLASEAHQRWPIGRVAIHHRIGRLNIGETAVVVVVAAPHREAAFAAVAYLMDRIKEVAPIWKKEFWADGEAEWRA
ncbi:molybdopterin converting factor subunit 1 [Candidatus Oscillochloris fontis]|uniref:molybdopterin converting factor subunit 1 n=1 Tax=Candidatus Oscillochloris fontis TaxID=2496868 RepID=UPI00101BD024|nr:molybdopterin converting factor subunit 1 [Candidatus Oscillochloris fontis]